MRHSAFRASQREKASQWILKFPHPRHCQLQDQEVLQRGRPPEVTTEEFREQINAAKRAKRAAATKKRVVKAPTTKKVEWAAVKRIKESHTSVDLQSVAERGGIAIDSEASMSSVSPAPTSTGSQRGSSSWLPCTYKPETSIVPRNAAALIFILMASCSLHH